MAKNKTLTGVSIVPTLSVKVNALGLRMVSVSATKKTIPHEVKELQKAVDGDLFDIQTRTINGEAFDFYCDDEALMKEDAVVTAMSKTSPDYNLVGALFIVKANDQGETISLTEDEVKRVLNAFNGRALVID